MNTNIGENTMNTAIKANDSEIKSNNKNAIIFDKIALYCSVAAIIFATAISFVIIKIFFTDVISVRSNIASDSLMYLIIAATMGYIGFVPLHLSVLKIIDYKNTAIKEKLSTNRLYLLCSQSEKENIENRIYDFNKIKLLQPVYLLFLTSLVIILSVISIKIDITVLITLLLILLCHYVLRKIKAKTMVIDILGCLMLLVLALICCFINEAESYLYMYAILLPILTFVFIYIINKLINGNDFVKYNLGLYKKYTTDFNNEIINDYKLTAKNAAMYYEDNAVFKNLNFELNDGDKLCFYGDNASGKSTLSRLLNGCMAPTKGLMLIGNTPIDRTDKTALNMIIANFDTEMPSIHISIRDFISGGNDITENQLNDIAEKSNLISHIEHYKYSYDTIINPVSLSITEKFYFSLARILYKKPKLIIIDGNIDYLSMSEQQTAINVLKSLPVSIIIMTSKSDIYNSFENKISLNAD